MKNHDQIFTISIFSVGVVALIISFFFDNLFLNFMESIRNPVFSYILNWASHAISLVFVMLIMTSLFMWEEKKRDWIIPTWIAFFTTLIVSSLLKLIVARERPGEYLVPILGWKTFAFPSSHAAVCFSLVAVFDRVYPMLKWFWVLFALVVAFSRLYLGEHFLSDVIAGGLIGFAIGLTLVHLKQKYNMFGAR